MAEDALRLERRERIAILTLNRPDRLNALNIELREALVHACQELHDDDDIWAVVLTGAGRGFCSGVDLRASRPDSEPAASRQERLDMYGWVGRQAMAVYRTLDKPIIAAVNGIAAGAGMSLALSCDMRVGSELTRFKTAGPARRPGSPGFVPGTPSTALHRPVECLLSQVVVARHGPSRPIAVEAERVPSAAIDYACGSS